MAEVSPAYSCHGLVAHFWSFFSTLSPITCVAVGVCLFIGKSYLRTRSTFPGPPRLPLLGNVLQVPTQMQFIRFTEWSQAYGSIFSLDVLGQHIVVVNTQKAAFDLFDRKSNLYSDRPRSIMAGEIMTGGKLMVLTRYGDLWRRMRRACYASFGHKFIQKYKSIQTKAASQSVLAIMKQPDTWKINLRAFTTSAILSSVYGWPALNADAPIVKRLHASAASISAAALPGAYLVDFIPVLNYIPAWLARWKREGMLWHEKETKMFEGLVADVADKVRTGEARQCFVTDMMNTKDKDGLSMKESAWLAGNMIAAGAETTAATLMNFVLAMVLNPEVVRNAQAEFDSVIGRARSPSWNDMDNLPYIHAIVKETLRWRPVAPLGVPRCATEDDWYEGHFIPKGAIVIGNIWSMNRDPALFHDFDKFRPERYLDSSGKLEDTSARAAFLDHVSYGFGRRICVGQSFANQSLFVLVATLLWACNIKPAMNEAGKEILPLATAWIDRGIVVEPAPFDCRISPRFADALTMLEMASGSL